MAVTETLDILNKAYNEFADSLYSYGCKFTNDTGLVRDCIHDIFVRMYEKKDLSQIKNMRFYLLRAFKNRLIDELSKTPFIEISESIPFSIPVTVNEEEVFLKNEEENRIKKKINDALDKLTDRQREAIYLYYIEELDYDKICVLMNMNYQSVRNLVHRAMTCLRNNLDPQIMYFLFTFFSINHLTCKTNFFIR